MARARRASPSSSHRAAPPPAHAPAPQQHSQQQQHHTSAQQPQQPQVTNIYVQRGGAGGAGTGILGTVASVAAGSVIGHGISHMLFNRDQPPAQPAQAQELAQQVGDGACSSQIKAYAKCLEANPENPENCKWAWEYFVQCQDEHQQK
ncbi:uncharacterized protein TM35_000351580 [Trypanosoma theileri]|uniref:CHCH domain-containing protein n=1 Tax=Trypanosoma theileri TaxID=67003 RepID=A0A1X0NKW3_9TRYP|nr:uncharacterized protein TM35_000351580 [Trypanosoma theileri]ORC85414.1 hypothetical protein TM35_000351580 [Trypanosoma theileri]